MSAIRCPLCKNGALQLFDSAPTMKTLTCSKCDKIITVKTGSGKILEVVVPGLTVLTSVVAILGFFGIHNVDELSSALDHLIDKVHDSLT